MRMRERNSDEGIRISAALLFACIRAMYDNYIPGDY